MKCNLINKRMYGRYKDTDALQVHINRDTVYFHDYRHSVGKQTSWNDGGMVRYYRPDYDADLINKKAYGHLGLRTKWFEQEW